MMRLFDLFSLLRRKALHGLFRKTTMPDAERLLLNASELVAKNLSQRQDGPPHVEGDPLISFVVPSFNTPPPYLEDLFTSFVRQNDSSIELIVSDDGSTSDATLATLNRLRRHANVRVILNPLNRGISHATNDGLAAARGTWIALIDHDDYLADGAVSQIRDAIRRYPSAAFIYTDEIITDANLRPTGYLLKPAYDPILLSGVNYINHLSLYRRQRLLELGGFRPGFEGSQDYDMLLRYLLEVPSRDIIHVPYPAYLWRRSTGTYSQRFLDQATTNARRSLQERYQDSSCTAVGPAITKSLHKLRFDRFSEHPPLVSIVIPSRDSYHLISRVLADLVRHTNYSNIEIIVVDNGSTDTEVLTLYEQFRKGPVPFIADVNVAPFNFARQVNRGIELASGEFVLLLNNDIEVVAEDWLSELVACFCYGNVGIVGAKLLFPDSTIQHAGVIVGLGDLAGHWYERHPADFPGPFARLHVRQSMSAVTAACMLISRDCLEQVGDFDEEAFSVAYNDVDFCLRALAKGFRCAWTPFATLIHHESASRGSDEAPQNRDRFAREKTALRERHQTNVIDDLYFSPWYTRDRGSPAVTTRVTLADARRGAGA
jgi:GT2 family glycosyltransferase